MKSDRNSLANQTSEEIAAILSRYRASGLGLKVFAREHGLPPGRLHYWLYQKHPGASGKRRPQPAKAALAPVFQELKLTPRSEWVGRWAAEVSLPRGIAVRFSTAATAKWVGSVVQAVQRPC
jgi:hypothetical protein